MRYRDKLRETKWNLENVKKYLSKEVIKFNQLDYFRFNFVAFIYSSRSVTLVIQKDLKHKDGFKEWWDEMRKEL